MLIEKVNGSTKVSRWYPNGTKELSTLYVFQMLGVSGGNATRHAGRYKQLNTKAYDRALREFELEELYIDIKTNAPSLALP